MPKKLMGWMCIFLIVTYCSVFNIANAYAVDSKSSTYTLSESNIDTNNSVESNSSSYKSSSATGDLVVGDTTSSGYQIQTGSQTTNDPALSFSIASGNINFGSFTPSAATVTTATFSVSNYTSYGYVVQIFGNAPSNGGHTITAMSSTDSSKNGVEQFGINLVANTSPVSVGANPNNGNFGYGLAAAGYNTSNQYRYISGETIASAPKSSGLTIYTISYLINVTGLTPGGQYTSNQTLIITGTY
jgi:hypothetical protein